MIWLAKGIDFYPSNPRQAGVWKEKRKGSALYPPMSLPSRSSTPLAFMRALDVLACPSSSRAPLELSTPFSLSRALCIHAQARFSLLSFRAPGDVQRLCAVEEVIIFKPRIKHNLEAPPHHLLPPATQKDNQVSEMSFQCWSHFLTLRFFHFSVVKMYRLLTDSSHFPEMCWTLVTKMTLWRESKYHFNCFAPIMC